MRNIWTTIPSWARTAIAALSIALGIVLVIRPTLALGVLALVIGAGFLLHSVLLLASTEHDRGVLRRGQLVEAALWLVGGVFVLTFPGLTVRMLAVIIAIGLLANGVRSTIDAFARNRTGDARIASAAFAVSSVGFGLLALLWPDITMLVAAVALGGRLIIGGIAELWRRFAVRTTSPKPHTTLWRTTRVVGGLATVALVIGAGALSMAVRGNAPVVDEFYAAPRTVPDEPGALIRYETFTRGVPEGAVAWRMLYTTTKGDGTPTVASGLVVVPAQGAGGWPVINWNHGTTGFAQQCAPSLAAEPFTSGALFMLPAIINEGWGVVTTDYIGLGTAGPHGYLVGKDAAHASLDALRASAQLAEARLAPSTLVWGHSQGGAAALWTAAEAPTYAPELDVRGVAALAPAANLPGLVENLPNVTGGSVFASFVVAGYSGTYDDVTWREYIRPGAEPVVRAMSERCLAEPGMLVSVLQSLALSADPSVLAKDPATGPLGARLAENVPPLEIPVPVFVAQGEADDLVIPSAQATHLDAMVASGTAVDYVIYPGLGHLSLVSADSPVVSELIRWSRARVT